VPCWHGTPIKWTKRAVPGRAVHLAMYWPNELKEIVSHGVSATQAAASTLSKSAQAAAHRRADVSCLCHLLTLVRPSFSNSKGRKPKRTGCLIQTGRRSTLVPLPDPHPCLRGSAPRLSAFATVGLCQQPCRIVGLARLHRAPGNGEPTASKRHNPVGYFDFRIGAGVL
jgi:hypothetical protein